MSTLELEATLVAEVRPKIITILLEVVTGQVVVVEAAAAA
jgi:hypothetical protein